MRIRVKKVDAGALRARMPHAVRGALFAVAENVLSDSTRHVPLKGGELRTSGRAEVTAGDHAEVEWGGDKATAGYAGPQFAGRAGGRAFKEYTTPGTGPDWTGRAEEARGEAWRRMFAVELGRGMRG